MFIVDLFIIIVYTAVLFWAVKMYGLYKCFLFENDLNIHSKCFNKSELYSFICQAINCLIKVKTLEFDIPEPMCIKGLQMGITLPIIE